jgi:hypothetical protein
MDALKKIVPAIRKRFGPQGTHYRAWGQCLCAGADHGMVRRLRAASPLDRNWQGDAEQGHLQEHLPNLQTGSGSHAPSENNDWLPRMDSNHE